MNIILMLYACQAKKLVHKIFFNNFMKYKHELCINHRITCKKAPSGRNVGVDFKVHFSYYNWMPVDRL